MPLHDCSQQDYQRIAPNSEVTVIQVMLGNAELNDRDSKAWLKDALENIPLDQVDVSASLPFGLDD